MPAPKIQDINEGLFESIQDLNIDAEDLGVDINIEEIGQESQDEAVQLIENLSKFYYDEHFMAAHPTFKRRVESDLDSIRLLVKMRKSDEIVQDALVRAIAKNTKNASLYKALSEMQRTIISITQKIRDIIDGLNTLMKGYQLELNFDGDRQIQTESDEGCDAPITTTRGSKEFIQRMHNEMSQE